MKENVCTPNPCENNGTCVQSGSLNAICSCTPNWTGPECEL